MKTPSIAHFGVYLAAEMAMCRLADRITRQTTLSYETKEKE